MEKQYWGVIRFLKIYQAILGSRKKMNSDTLRALLITPYKVDKDDNDEDDDNEDKIKRWLVDPLTSVSRPEGK